MVLVGVFDSMYVRYDHVSRNIGKQWDLGCADLEGVVGTWIVGQGGGMSLERIGFADVGVPDFGKNDFFLFFCCWKVWAGYRFWWH